MKKKKINPNDYSGMIMDKIQQGVLLTTKNGEKVNSMIIGWGAMGVNWGLPVFTAYVRESRYSRELLDKTGEFTINVPVGEIDKNIFKICAGKSGRDTDKISEAGLTTVEPNVVSVPGIKECPITLECKVLYRQKMEKELMDNEKVSKWYADGNMHIAYYAEIVDAYIIED